MSDYERARKIGLRQVSDARSHGRNPYPEVLDELTDDGKTLGQVSLGTMEIPLDLVAGTRTRGRQNTFSCGFMPLADPGSEFATKWGVLHQSQLEEGLRDPIVVYEYYQRFYVQEGNKRVSVARYVDMPSIAASVTRVLPAPEDSDRYQRYQEFLRLWRVCPVWGLDFSSKGSCQRLARLLGQSLDEEWPAELVSRLRATFTLFGKVLRAHGGAARGVGLADAFIKYVQAYAPQGALGVSEREMDARIGRMIGELALLAKDEPIAFAKSIPEAKAKGAHLSSPRVVSAMRGIRVPMIAFVYDGDPGTSGWIAQHERGRVELQNSMAKDVRTLVYYGCGGDDAFDAAIEDAQVQGAHLTVTASPRQFEQTVRAAIAYPKAHFANCSINLSSDRVMTYYARMYEAKFILGALAGCLASNHRIGYVATSPIFGAVSEVNAFALGVSMVDPYATVQLVWRSAADAESQGCAWGEDVRVVSGIDYHDPTGKERQSGLFRIDDEGEIEHLATPVWDWGRYYQLIAQSLIDGSWNRDERATRHQARNYWLGLDSGVVRIRLARGLPEGQRRLVALLESALIRGVTTPFDGVLYDQMGLAKHEEGEPRLRDEQLASMSWLAPNVVGRLPRQSELTEVGRRSVEAAGVIGDEE